ncbi:MAG: class I SAM-dependent methyltransferase, partial [Janthinobacterium sp.]
MNSIIKKLVADQKEWDVVSKELEGENLKLASYDNTLMNVIGNVNGKKILDYGAGPGVLALGLQKMGANVKVWDTGIEMQEKSALKIGKENVYANINTVPKGYFDIIICNLVLCIVPEDEAKSIVENMKQMLAPGGFIYIGFCNPKIFQIPESNLDYRLPTPNKYEDNHDYKKVKKEGNYEIIESHR